MSVVMLAKLETNLDLLMG